jgi:DNA polymerase III delta subunit
MPRFVVIAKDPLLAAEGAAAHIPVGVPCERHYAEELVFETVFAQLGNLDLFATQRAYVYIDFLELKLSKGEEERFVALLQQLPREITLVCTQVVAANTRAEEQKLLRKPAYFRVAQGAHVDNLLRQSDPEQAAKWLLARAREKHSLALSMPQARRIYAASGEQLAVAAAELSKLSLLQGDGRLQPVADALLDSSLSQSPVARLHELAGAILRDSPQAQELLLAWFRIEPETHRLVAELRRRFLGLRAVAHGEKVQPPFFDRQLREIATYWPPPRLKRAIVLLAELEYALKGGGVLVGETSEEAELGALQVFLADLARLQ